MKYDTSLGFIYLPPKGMGFKGAKNPGSPTELEQGSPLDGRTGALNRHLQGHASELRIML